METTAKEPLLQRFVRGCKEPATLRLLLVAAAIAVSWWVTVWAWASLKPPDVDMPDRDYRNLPHEIGQWRGVDKELDPKIFAAIGANYVVDRVYRSGRHRISLHLAVFDNPDEGVRHSPMNCYLGQGYRNASTKRTSLELADQPEMEMLLTTWEKDQKRILVGYWFKMGEYLLFDRTDMAVVRLKLRGKQSWPALVKVLIHYDLAGSRLTDEDTNRLREFAVMVEKWIGAPDDESALKLIGGGAAASRAPRSADEEKPPQSEPPPADGTQAVRGVAPPLDGDDVDQVILEETASPVA
jgi:EpsI family protein